ncbi:hypothetical protein NQ317_012297 [Molorchus minor]|uniref:Lsm14-like N-terminal domain-containing protein n=1 Tax=Molorchus minor TaxID=1323400 RepID=A0ABQ9J1L3_9CUCU|nr:hypothetical protein NQ317_012297 [Molorchus minor]
MAVKPPHRLAESSGINESDSESISMPNTKTAALFELRKTNPLRIECLKVATFFFRFKPLSNEGIHLISVCIGSVHFAYGISYFNGKKEKKRSTSPTSLKQFTITDMEFVLVIKPVRFNKAKQLDIRYLPEISSNMIWGIISQMDLPCLKLKQDVCTRWNSTYDMIMRYLSNKEAIIATLALINNEINTLTMAEWELLEKSKHSRWKNLVINLYIKMVSGLYIRSFGTEERETQYPVPAQNQVYDYILFRGSDIKDIRVVNNVTHPQPLNDPAIMQLSVPPSLGGQAFQGHPVLGPMGQQIGQFGGAYGSIGAMGGLAPGMGPSLGIQRDSRGLNTKPSELLIPGPDPTPSVLSPTVEPSKPSNNHDNLRAIVYHSI